TPMEGKPIRQIGILQSAGSELRCGPNELILMIGGMGPVNAKQIAEKSLKLDSEATNGRKPDAVLSIGLCGGLSRSLSEGRIVAYTDCLSTHSTMPALTCSPVITDSVSALLKRADIICDRVTGITSSRFATTPSEKLELAQSGAF